jgi:predicted ATPase
MLARLNHPNITQIYDAGFEESEDRLYLVMEYVEGEDLAEVLTRGPLSIEGSLMIAQGILAALSAAHGCGIVHRDLKPSNVRIGDDVKLTDFGLADLKSILQQGTDWLVGTPAYMAPEQIEKRAVDGRADLYSLGVVLYEMLSGGCLPFDCADPAEMMEAHLHADPPPLSHFAPAVPPALDQVALRLLAKDPEERYSSAEAVVEALGAVRVGPKLGKLPVWLTPFVGRENELAALRERLQDPACRLLTLVGPGGVGKTRLAVEVARACADSFADGVFFVPLAPLQPGDAVVPTVAHALNFSFYTAGGDGADVAPRQQLLDYLRNKSLLLVLDNAEHLLAEHPLASARLVTDLLKTAPAIKIVVTSRARLNVQTEHLFPVPGMSVPEFKTAEDATERAERFSRHSAIALFLSSARRVRPKVGLEEDDLTYIAQICRQVQGVPLAILLAAAWVEMLTPAEIAAEIGRGLDFLEGDLSDLPERQRSVRSLFDHSWNLLPKESRETFQGLSAFRGGFSQHAARQVSGVTLRDLMYLTHRSLLHRTLSGRYEVHELLRQYAEEKLEASGKAQVVRDAHCAYYSAALQSWEQDLKGAGQQEALAEMEVEIENARAAWVWAVEQGQVERLAQAMDGLCRFYERRVRFQDGAAVCQATVESLRTSSGNGLCVLVGALTWQSAFNQRLGHVEAARQLVRESLGALERCKLDVRDVQQRKARALLQMGHMANTSGDRKHARRLYAQSRKLFEGLEDRWSTASVLHSLGQVAWELGAYDEARQLHEQSLTIRQSLGDRRGVADSLGSLCWVAHYHGQIERAERLARQSLAIRQELSDQVGVARGLYDLSVPLMGFGRFDEARSLLQESVAIYDQLGARLGLADSTTLLGWVDIICGRYQQGRDRMQLGLELSTEIQHQHGIGRALAGLGYAALGQRAYTEAQRFIDKSIAVLREIEAWDELGWVLAHAAYVERKLGRPRRARRSLLEVLQIGAKIEAWIPLVIGLPAAALLLADQGQARRAVELYALACRYPNIANSTQVVDIAGRQIAAIAATLPPDVVAAAQERGRARDVEATVVELYLELKIALLLPDPLSGLRRPLARLLHPILTPFLRRKYGRGA